MTELYLNGTRIDLYTNPAVSLTRQINNLGELKDRQASYTNTITIPKSTANVAFFDGLGAVIGSESRTPYDLLTARFVVDSVLLLEDGKAIVKETADSYQCAIFDDNIHLVDIIGSKALNELVDLPTLNHDLTTTNFVNSFGNVSTNGYVYAISDFGNFSLSGIIINNQLPSFFAKWIFDKIFEDAGYTHDLTLDDSLLITPKRGYDTLTDIGSASEINASAEASLNYYGGGGAMGYGEELLPMNYTPPTTVGYLKLEDYKFSVTQSALLYFEFTTTTSNVFLASIKEVQIWKNNTFYTSCGENDTIQVAVNIGDVIQIYYNVEYEKDPYLTSTIDINSDVRFYSVAGGSGLTLLMNSFIGEVKQYDFIKDIMQLYGLVSKKVKGSNEIQFKRMADILNDKANAYDWNDRVILESESYELGNYAKSNLFKYKYRQADGEQFADGRLFIRNETLKPETVILTRPYNAPENSTALLNSEVVTYTPFWEAERDDTGAVTKWKVIKGINYFGKLKTTNTSIVYKTSGGTNQNYTGDVPMFDFKNLTYQDFLTDNYQEIKNVFDSYKELKVKVKMNLFEFEAFDFFKLIYCKQLGGYYYVNSLKWTNGKTHVDAEIIKVN